MNQLELTEQRLIKVNRQAKAKRKQAIKQLDLKTITWLKSWII